VFLVSIDYINILRLYPLSPFYLGSTYILG
jgi:hypothetical protein